MIWNCIWNFYMEELLRRHAQPDADGGGAAGYTYIYIYIYIYTIYYILYTVYYILYTKKNSKQASTIHSHV